jgi:GNAT superfamily N-acetyltransferase
VTGDGYLVSDDPSRVDLDVVWQFLSTQAYWGRHRSREDVTTQVERAWRVVGAYEPAGGSMVGFARAVSDGIGIAYLADVFVLQEHRGHGLGVRLVEEMIERGPGAALRWVLFTEDAHELYARFGFRPPDSTLLERPARPELSRRAPQPGTP